MVASLSCVSTRSDRDLSLTANGFMVDQSNERLGKLDDDCAAR